MTKNKIALAVHGGAGTILRSLMTAELEHEYRSGLQSALLEGWKILHGGGTALDVVEAAVVELENCPLFNAGRGAVFTHDGRNELDASIMDGANGKAGAIAFVRNVKNPIRLARLVMERTEHILLAGDGAIQFAREMQIEFAPNEYFFTDFRYQQLLEAQEIGKVQLDHTAGEQELIEEEIQNKIVSQAASRKPPSLGTVGAVACDSFGNVAAATSTGGMTNKKFGRVGDTPIIGEGTYAENKTCAVSCTGHGEFFMRAVAAYDVAARMKYKNCSVIEAASETIEYLKSIGGEGGLIAVDCFGKVALPFNSSGMYRGFVLANGTPVIEIYR